MTYSPPVAPAFPYAEPLEELEQKAERLQAELDIAEIASTDWTIEDWKRWRDSIARHHEGMAKLLEALPEDYESREAAASEAVTEEIRQSYDERVNAMQEKIADLEEELRELRDRRCSKCVASVARGAEGVPIKGPKK